MSASSRDTKKQESSRDDLEAATNRLENMTNKMEQCEEALLDEDSDGELNATTNESETTTEETAINETVVEESESENAPIAGQDSELPRTLIVDGPINPSDIAAMADSCLHPTKK